MKEVTRKRKERERKETEKEKRNELISYVWSFSLFFSLWVGTFSLFCFVRFSEGFFVFRLCTPPLSFICLYLQSFVCNPPPPKFCLYPPPLFRLYFLDPLPPLFCLYPPCFVCTPCVFVCTCCVSFVPTCNRLHPLCFVCTFCVLFVLTAFRLYPPCVLFSLFLRMAKFLFFLVVLVLFSPFTHQKKTLCPKQHNTTKTPSSSSSSSSPGGIFILSTGNEGSGTTSTARLLIHDWGIGIPTNWGTKELDPEIRSRHCPLSQGLINTFNTITSELWQAKLQNVYYRKKREKLIKQAARTIRMIAQTTQTKRIIYHRSMPFQNPTTSPHLEDLPLIARQIGKELECSFGF